MEMKSNVKEKTNTTNEWQRKHGICMSHRRLPEFFVTGMSVLADQSQLVNAKTIANLWKRFSNRVNTISTRVHRSSWRKFGITYDAIPGTQYMYMAAVETNTDASHSGMKTMRIPAMEYLCFTHAGSFWQIKDTYRQIYKNIIPENSIKKLPAAECGIEHLEWYDHHFHWSKPESKIFIYIPMKKAL